MNVYVSNVVSVNMADAVFGVWDYVIMAATMVASIVIGLYFRFSGGKQKTNEVGTYQRVTLLLSNFKVLILRIRMHCV